MNERITVEASGKINIGLEIGYPREDGYHPIRSIFHSVGITDLLVFTKTANNAITIEGTFDCPMEKTTVYKGAELFAQSTGMKIGLRARVEKRIPTMAGLGGGSADAAATLVALDKLYKTKLDSAVLAAMAAEIGSDVPFFLAGGAAIVSGKGEVIEPIEARRDFGVLLVWPGFGVSTKWAYSALDLWRSAKNHKGASFEQERREALAKAGENVELASAFIGNPLQWEFRNSFADMLYEAFPVYCKLEAMLRKSGAVFVSITGSGSCMYGIYLSMDEACAAEEKLKASNRTPNEENTLYGMALHAIKPLETSLLLG